MDSYYSGDSNGEWWETGDSGSENNDGMDENSDNEECGMIAKECGRQLAEELWPLFCGEDQRVTNWYEMCKAEDETKILPTAYFSTVSNVKVSWYLIRYSRGSTSYRVTMYQEMIQNEGRMTVDFWLDEYEKMRDRKLRYPKEKFQVINDVDEFFRSCEDEVLDQPD